MSCYKIYKENIFEYNIEVGLGGKSDAPVMVFAHGLGGNLRQWDQQVEYFSPSFRTITFSLQGHGESTKPEHIEDYTIEHYGDVVIHLLNRLKVTSCIWVGNSMGGVIGYEVLSRKPELISQLITNGTAPALEYGKATLKMIGTMDRFLINILGYERYLNIAVNATFRDKEQRMQLKKIFAMAHPLAVIASHQLLGNYNYLKTLEQAKIPVTFIITPKDKDINKAIYKYDNELKEIDNLSFVKKTEGGHIYNLEMPYEYNLDIEKSIHN